MASIVDAIPLQVLVGLTIVFGIITMAVALSQGQRATINAEASIDRPQLHSASSTLLNIENSNGDEHYEILSRFFSGYYSKSTASQKLNNGELSETVNRHRLVLVKINNSEADGKSFTLGPSRTGDTVEFGMEVGDGYRNPYEIKLPASSGRKFVMGVETK